MKNSMKKVLTILTTLCLVLVAGTLLAACGEADDGIKQKEDPTALYGASITSWWQPNGEGHSIDTSVTFNFDKIKITDIDRITFEIFDGNTSMGKAVSEDQKLTKLLNECKQYWEKDGGQNYTQEDALDTITGNGRKLSCNFYEIGPDAEAQYFDDIWTYSNEVTVKYVDGQGAEGEKMPNRLVVKVLVGKTEYKTSFTVGA